MVKSYEEQLNREIPILYLVVPCYNEEEIIQKTAAVLRDKIIRLINEGKIKSGSKVMFVNDGSKDGTLKMLHDLYKQDSIYSVVSLAGNSGHQYALMAGMMTAKNHADVIVSVDADLQQDIEALDDFLACYMDGCEVVYGVRNDRHSDGLFKKASASMYYGLMHAMGSRVIANHADYRLLSKTALMALAEYKESNLFLRGLIPTMGFKSDIVYFDVKKREAGVSKYTLKKMLNLAFDGITSFSIVPLHFIAGLGGLMVMFSLVMAVISFVDYINNKNVPGYTTILSVVLIMSGVIMLSLGVIGEYIGKMYMETKNRPRYYIDSVAWKDNANEKS